MLAVNNNRGPRACTTCAKAKSRCVPGPAANICERCHRLNKPCGSQTPAPPRRRRIDGNFESAGAARNEEGQAQGGVSSRGASRQPSKPQHRSVTKPTRVAELERRLEDLTSRLDSVSQQQLQNREINMSQSSDTSNDDSPIGIFRVNPRWGYCYPARHLFPVDDMKPPAGQGRGAAGRDDEPRDAFVPRKTNFSQQHPGISPPLTIASPASNANNNSSTSDVSSTSSAPTSSVDMDTEHFPAHSLIPDFTMPGQRSFRPDRAAAAAKLRGPTTASKQPTQTSTSGGGTGASGVPTPASLPPLRSPASSDMWPGPEEAEIMLSKFRTYLMPLFPFVIVPDYITSAQLRVGRPITWKAIMTAACYLDGARQMQLGNQLQGEMAAAAFLQPRRTLDLLQAVLVSLGWFHYHINSFQLNNLLYLARAMCVSLGISEPTPLVTLKSSSGGGGGDDDDDEPDCGEGESNPLRQTTEYPPVSLERMRTFAGTFYLVTLATATNKKHDAMMNSAHLETCCQILERQMEYPSDAYLVQLVRVQQLSQSISVAFSLRADGIQMGLSLRHLLQDLRQQIDAFKAQLPEVFQNDGPLNGHLHTAEILLYEVGLQETGHPSLQGETISNSDRLELLGACMLAVKEFMHNRFLEHVSDQPRFLCLSSFDFMFAFLTALKLMILQAPGWDGRRVRTELAFDDLIDRQILDLQVLSEWRSQQRFRLSSVGPSANADMSNKESSSSGGGGERAVPPLHVDPLSRLAARMTELKSMIAKELDKIPATGNANPYMHGGQGPAPVGPASIVAMMSSAMAAPDSPAAATDAPPSSSALNGTAGNSAAADTTTTAATPFEAASINGEPILSFADATIDYMQNLDFPDMFNAPGWESYMDVNMGTPSFHDPWGQMNL